MGLNIFVGSTIQPCGLKLPVPGPARPPPPRPALEVPPALLGPGAAQASTSFPRSQDPRFPPLPPPGSPSSVPKSRIAFLSTAPPGAMTLSLRFSPGRRGQADGVVGQADASSLPPRTSGPTLAFSASPARSRRRGRVLASYRPPLVTERRAPRIVLLRHATRFICPIVLFRGGQLLFPSLSMLKSLRTPLILTNTFTSTGGFAGLVAMTSGGTLSWGHLSSAPGAELPVCMCHLGPHGNPRIDVSRINSKSALRPSLSWWATLRKGAAMPLQVNRGSRGENLRVSLSILPTASPTGPRIHPSRGAGKSPGPPGRRRGDF